MPVYGSTLCSVLCVGIPSLTHFELPSQNCMGILTSVSALTSVYTGGRIHVRLSVYILTYEYNEKELSK